MQVGEMQINEKLQFFPTENNVNVCIRNGCRIYFSKADFQLYLLAHITKDLWYRHYFYEKKKIYHPGKSDFSLTLAYFSQNLSHTHQNVSSLIKGDSSDMPDRYSFSAEWPLVSDFNLTSRLKFCCGRVRSNKTYCSSLQRDSSGSMYLAAHSLSLSLAHASFKMKEDRKALETTRTLTQRPN